MQDFGERVCSRSRRGSSVTTTSRWRRDAYVSRTSYALLIQSVWMLLRLGRHPFCDRTNVLNVTPSVFPLFAQFSNDVVDGSSCIGWQPRTLNIDSAKFNKLMTYLGETTFTLITGLSVMYLPYGSTSTEETSLPIFVTHPDAVCIL